MFWFNKYKNLENDKRAMLELTPSQHNNNNNSKNPSESSEVTDSELSSMEGYTESFDTPDGFDYASFKVWSEIIRDWEDNMKRRPKFIRDLTHKGIPEAMRCIVWQYFTGAWESALIGKYASLIEEHSACERMIKRDIARTFPEHPRFQKENGHGQQGLFNVIKAYSIYDKAVGYCQGSMFIAGMLLMKMPEEETFCVFVKLMEDYGMRELYKPNMSELGLCIYQLENLVQEMLPELHGHLQAQGFQTAMYASSWFLTLFSSVFPLNVAFRIMDMFISDGREILFRLSLALLTLSVNELLKCDMEEMLMHFQKTMPEKYADNFEVVVEEADRMKMSVRKMKRFEKDYTRTKSKEVEDSEEIRRLKTEKSILIHRINGLEDECANLADKLIKDQVTRAQEQEEMYVIKRELSILTKRFETMKTELERSMERESELLKYKKMVEKSQNESKNHKMVNPFALEPS
ncbi:EVI5-like protein isoform X2 [Xenia sp. Carnegie-2017]|uniref:EVI5-like protein isoform X2 n=1 Tax=Xenia sp. Carnegie-2017 TaxID=2897299 RepID=UPI001F039967|nr:EVI5-like protein isoform X2 [Xenia sp. Carnegie-2017]